MFFLPKKVQESRPTGLPAGGALRRTSVLPQVKLRRRRNSLPPSLLKERLEAASGGRDAKRKTSAEKQMSFFLVDLEGFEPLTSRMRTERSPN